MKFIFQLLFCLVLVVVAGGEESASQREQALTAEIQNARVLPGQTAIAFDFVITNKSPKSVSIAERWNSWGAFQWTIQLENADGSKFDFTNSQEVWYSNKLTVATIEPKKEYRSRFKLTLGHSGSIADCIDTFAVGWQPSKQPTAHFSFPLRLVGVFAAEYQKSGDLATNWTGTIKTNEVKVDKESEQAGGGNALEPPSHPPTAPTKARATP